MRINTQSQYDDKIDLFTKSITKKGAADVYSVLDGVPYFIEVKIGRDIQNEYQEVTQAKVELAGSLFSLPKTINHFTTGYQLPEPAAAAQ